MVQWIGWVAASGRSGLQGVECKGTASKHHLLPFITCYLSVLSHNSARIPVSNQKCESTYTPASSIGSKKYSSVQLVLLMISYILRQRYRKIQAHDTMKLLECMHKGLPDCCVCGLLMSFHYWQTDGQTDKTNCFFVFNFNCGYSHLFLSFTDIW